MALGAGPGPDELGIHPVAERLASARTYLMCPPEKFVVEYAINAWMDTSVPVDTDLAVKQWTMLRMTRWTGT